MRLYSCCLFLMVALFSPTLDWCMNFIKHQVWASKCVLLRAVYGAGRPSSGTGRPPQPTGTEPSSRAPWACRPPPRTGPVDEAARRPPAEARVREGRQHRAGRKVGSEPRDSRRAGRLPRKEEATEASREERPLLTRTDRQTGSAAGLGGCGAKKKGKEQQ